LTDLSAAIDVVIVSYNSRGHLRGAVEPLAGQDGIHVIVVDNASRDGSLEAVAGLDVSTIPLERNLGFAGGCNRGWRAGAAPYVLFLNPDARIEPESLRALVSVLAADECVGLVGPHAVDPEGATEYSQRRFPRVRSTFAQALFLQRLFPRAPWSDEMIRDAAVYAKPRSAEWLSGACLVARRSLLEQLGGWDERFFLYCEDMDLCRRTHDAGYEVRFEPTATAMHVGGGSAPRGSLLPVLVASRLRYARKHRGRAAAALERFGIALGSATHLLLGRRDLRAGHARSLLAVFSSRDARTQS
jgi:N-acetylglucosaminyl-diphospho-decaprenol L-rhamnosyltransferase